MGSWFNKIFNVFSKKDDSIKTDNQSIEKNKPVPDSVPIKQNPESSVITSTNTASSITLTVRAYTSDDDAEINTDTARFVPNRNFSFHDYFCHTDKTDTFTAIDFETANQYPDSICQIGFAVVEKGRITEVKGFLVKPPYDDFRNSKIHGITADDVSNSPTFAELWPEIKHYIEDRVLAAYNARFDIGCLEAVLDRYDIPSPDYMFFDILQSARQIDSPMKDHKLGTVAKALTIDQKKAHDAADDAKVAAEIHQYAFFTQKYLYNNIYFKMHDKEKIQRLQREIMSGDYVWREVSGDYPKCKNLPFEECTTVFNACKIAAERGCKDAHMYRAYGELLEKAGDKKQALTMYQKAISIDSKIGVKKKIDKLLKEFPEVK